MAKWYDESWEQVVEKVDRISDRIKDTFPHVSIDGKYDSQRSGWWTAGFWPGLLWLIYKDTKEDKLKEYAVSCEEKLDYDLNNFLDIHHDVGFMWILSSVAHYKLLNDEAAKRRGLIAASHLAGRFNIKGNFIRAWNDNVFNHSEGWAIIDCMMNIPLLYWASEETKDPRFKHIAMAHTDTVIKEFIREDGSVHHIVCFDPNTGKRLNASGGQGYSPESAWARGSAWAIYGLSIGYGYTKEKRYLEKAKQATDFFLANLPDDKAPCWDFRAPKEQRDGKDTSAAACAASGMLEMCKYLEGSQKEYYYKNAEEILKSLYENYGAWDEDEEALIKMGTVNYTKQKYVNTPIIYGDYFFVEALEKLRGENKIFW
ncbi:glycoside hydrolase family 88 protein [Vallitalea guaymasensis]|uniref:glycoside hydrolase family 88 protein n=1 Tax=Vallitalea guaymasensis TaxID=1185412 RepID=UPI000DE4BCA9|nr:glycoside hydrolase family 88 protein [Vallitalea guaymasensis]